MRICWVVYVWVGDSSSGQGHRELVRAPFKIIFRAPRQGLACKDENYRNKAENILCNMAPGRKAVNKTEHYLVLMGKTNNICNIVGPQQFVPACPPSPTALPLPSPTLAQVVARRFANPCAYHSTRVIGLGLKDQLHH